MSAFQFEIVTPERTVLKTEVESVILDTTSGQLAIWANHAPLIAALDIGVVEYGPKQEEKEKASVSGGFVEVTDNKVTILANTAELSDEIDLFRAKEARERAEKRLTDKQSEWDYTRSKLALEKSIARINAAEDDDD